MIMSIQYATDEQIEQLAKALASSEFTQQGGGTEKFCEIWPRVEEGLTALQGVLALVPATSVLGGPAIGMVRAAGSAAVQAFCKK
jgi:hypothetical protein